MESAMRMLSCVSFLLLGVGGAQATEGLTLSTGAKVSVDASGRQARLRFDAGGSKRYLALDTDAATDAGPVRLKILADAGNGAVVLTDTHPSRPGGLSLCKAGKETFLRVLNVSPTQLDEVARIKVASCNDNIELADDGLEWDKGSSSIDVRWLSGPFGTKMQQSFKIMLNARRNSTK